MYTPHKAEQWLLLQSHINHQLAGLGFCSKNLKKGECASYPTKKIKERLSARHKECHT
jgi:hypothetical protein